MENNSRDNRTRQAKKTIKTTDTIDTYFESYVSELEGHIDKLTDYSIVHSKGIIERLSAIIERMSVFAKWQEHTDSTNKTDKPNLVTVFQIEGPEASGKTTIYKVIDSLFNTDFYEGSNNPIVKEIADTVKTDFDITLKQKIKQYGFKQHSFIPAKQFRNSLKQLINKSSYFTAIKDTLYEIGSAITDDLTTNGFIDILLDAFLSGFIWYVQLPYTILPETKIDTLKQSHKTFESEVSVLVEQEFNRLGILIQSLRNRYRTIRQIPFYTVIGYDRFLLSNLVYTIITHIVVNTDILSPKYLGSHKYKNSNIYEYVSENNDLSNYLFDTTITEIQTSDFISTAFKRRIKNLENLYFVSIANDTLLSILTYKVDNSVYGYENKKLRHMLYTTLLLIRYLNPKLEQQIQSLEQFTKNIKQWYKTLIQPSIFDFIYAFAYYNVHVFDRLMSYVSNVFKLMLPDHIADLMIDIV